MTSAKRLRHTLEYGAVRALRSLVARMPLGPALACGAVWGRLAFDLVRVRRRVTLENLRAAFGGEMEERELVRIGRESYRNFARSMIEFARLPQVDGDYVDRHLELEGLTHLDSALAGGRGVILITGHYGSWELLGGALALRGYPLNYLVGEQSNRKVDALVNRLRVSRGIGVIPRGLAMRAALRALGRGEIVAFLADQDAGKQGIFVDFFGRPASTHQGPAALSLRTGAPLVMAFMIRRQGARHHALVLPPLAVSCLAETARTPLERLTQSHVKALEGYVRLHPAMWFWPHRRWKTPSPGSRPSDVMGVCSG